MPYGKLSWRNRELRLFYDEKRKRTIANPVMLQIYGDSVQTVRQDNRLACARGQLRSQSKKKACRKSSALQHSRAKPARRVLGLSTGCRTGALVGSDGHVHDQGLL